MDQERTQQVIPLWIEDLQRHREDLRLNTYEGASGPGRVTRYRAAFDLLSPVVIGVLAEANASLLGGAGEVSIRTPEPDGQGGQIGSWMLTWPALKAAMNRLSGRPLPPVTISAVFPHAFVHPHLISGSAVDARADSITAWPMQVASSDDAERRRLIIEAIAAAEIHDRIYQSSWGIIQT
jgi:hypothetical protein